MSECSCIYVDSDYDLPSFFSDHIRTAKRQHVCCECGRTIILGERYECASGVWDGDWSTYKTCEDCLGVRAEMFCDGWIYGDLWSDVAGHVCDMGGHIDATCLARLTKRSRDRLCDMIEEWWEEDDE